ncbi:PREDICTED: probable protein phosphatase 2C 78 isoform X2 [Lupinus angustifolius]|uniref:probable protein phosphatase 2C 78 isoform X2 n=1 Tax=Lupinus angustifolius TaxID=3871 RepID=UPI00092FB5C7|nr:PREDICTED: probable protein phosphatase 2C 78 isoform X2 [Lupinus angustifolius]
MLELCRRPFETCFGGGGGSKDSLLWHEDLEPHASGEYSIAVVQANSLLEDQGQVFNTPSATFIGVYDGHGGPEASRFITKHLFSFLHKFISEEGEISEEVIMKAFNATEEEFWHLVKQSWITLPHIAVVGSCCLLGVISNNNLYVANLGDSRAVLGRKALRSQVNCAAVVAERLSTDHNVGVEEIRKEVEALHPDDAHIVVHTRGVWRIKGIIQVSRSIGDVYLKKPEFDKNPLFQQFVCPVPLKRPVITTQPSILTRKLTAEDLFLIFASDGLWEHLTDEAAVEIVFRSPRKDFNSIVGNSKTIGESCIGRGCKEKRNEICRFKEN